MKSLPMDGAHSGVKSSVSDVVILKRQRHSIREAISVAAAACFNLKTRYSEAERREHHDALDELAKQYEGLAKLASQGPEAA